MFEPTWRWSKGIAIIGAESSGKSTLISHVEQLVEVPILKELVRTLMRKSGLASPPAYGCDFGVTCDFQGELQQVRNEAQAAVGGPFIEDRSTVDSYAYTLACCGKDPKSQEWLKTFTEECYLHAKQAYQLIILVPSGKLPVVPDGVRNPLPFNAMMMYYLILGILQDWEIVHYVLQTVDLNERTAEVLAILNQHNLIKGKGTV